MCLITQALVAFIQFSSLSHHILISFDRVYAVYKPISYRNRKRKGLQTAISIFIIWSFSFLETALTILILSSPNNKTVMCESETVFGNRLNQYYVYCFGRFFISHLIIYFNYVIMLHYMKKHRRVVALHQSEGTESQSVDAPDIARNAPLRQKSGKEWKIAKTVIVTVCVFTICYLPMETGFLLNIAGIPVPSFAVHLYRFLLILNSVLNPIVYNTFLPGFRESLKAIGAKLYHKIVG